MSALRPYTLSCPSFINYITVAFQVHREVKISYKVLRFELALILTLEILSISFTYISKLFLNKFIEWRNAGHQSLISPLLLAHRSSSLSKTRQYSHKDIKPYHNSYLTQNWKPEPLKRSILHLLWHYHNYEFTVFQK